MNEQELLDILERSFKNTDVKFECHFVGDEKEKEIYIKFENVEEV